MEKLTKELILAIEKIVTDNGCWITPGGREYPTLYYKKKNITLSRIVTHLWHGLDLNDAFQVACHSCNNSKCFNPEHVYRGSDNSNMFDAVKAGTHVQTRKTHHTCGRPYDTIVHRSDGSTERNCTYCRRMRTQAHRMRKRQKEIAKI